MTDPSQLRPAPPPAGIDVEVKRAEVPSPELNRYLLAAVGSDWHWNLRLDWTYQRWLDVIAQSAFETWVVYVSGTPAGYFELEAQDGGVVEILSFGLLPQFIGKGLGGYALTEAIRCGFATGAHTVWLHTRTLDHPHALANYLARGMTVFRTVTQTLDDPGEPPGPWPGARRLG
jgi:ribosomal protein S18 acetylase RimI-like enzyme